MRGGFLFSKGQTIPSEGDSLSTDLAYALSFCPAVRTIAKMLLEGLAATVATYGSQIHTRRVDIAAFVGNMAASFALDKWLPLADSQYGDKKER
jgi:hypothetical protein